MILEIQNAVSPLSDFIGEVVTAAVTLLLVFIKNKLNKRKRRQNGQFE